MAEQDGSERSDGDTAPATLEGPVRAFEPLRPGALAPWLLEGMRCAALLAPRWRPSLQLHPAVLLALIVLHLLALVLLERLLVPGPAQFHAPALLSGWVGLLALGWVAHLLRPVPGLPARPTQAPSSAHLLYLLLAQQWWSIVAWGLVAVVAMHAGWLQRAGAWLGWTVFLADLGWAALAQALLLVRAAPGRPAAVAVAVLLVGAVSLVGGLYNPLRSWYPAEATRNETVADAAAPAPEPWDAAALEAQWPLLGEQLARLRPQRRGVVDLYGLSFAPYGDEPVFEREAAMVADVLARRHDAEGRTLVLANDPHTVRQRPWATPQNLQRAIAAVAARMDRDEDILFLHLTSHGARDGELAASLGPLSVQPLTPGQLKQWLDEAGVRWRVISVSACYSGSWIAPLADAQTLVMTAADAEHTSYGCGRLSELTFYGRAVFEEQLREHTLSFEAAHAAARPVIEQREREAGKDDGYSNPQIHVGEAIRRKLALLQSRLQPEQPAAPAGP